MNAPNTPAAAPYYRTVGEECTLFRCAFEESLPILLKGPTGCGKSRFVQAMAHELGRGLVTVACNEETNAADLLGRWLVRGGVKGYDTGSPNRPRVFEEE